MTKIVLGDKLQPFRVELDESSGPVSPRFQYTLTIAAWSEGDQVHLVREERSGAARRKSHASGVLTPQAARSLTGALERHDALSRGSQQVTATMDDKGLSCNRLVVVVGNARAELHYLLDTLEEPSHAAEAAIVRAVKAAAATLPIDE